MTTSTNHISPLMLQVKASWSEAEEEEKEVCIDEAIEACDLVYKIIGGYGYNSYG
mgnify:CR=1 FL=1